MTDIREQVALTKEETLAAFLATVKAIEAVGRAVAMGIGLGSFVEKVDEYCGKQIARWFIILMVLAVSVFCMKAIWDNLVDPFL